MVYFDSAYIAKFYLAEPESARVRALAKREGRVCCSALGRVETAQVFHRKLREGQASKSECNALFDQFETDCESGLWTWLPLTDDLVASAVQRCRGLSTNGNCSRESATLPIHAAIDGGGNVSDDATCPATITQVALADLHLGALAPNGGPTQTIALGTGSVAINAGINAIALDA